MENRSILTEGVRRLQVGSQTAYFGTSEHMTEVEDASIAVVLTSPPYWNLKDYQCPGQIGQEPYDTYLERLNVVWSECYRVSKPNGVLVINVAARRHRGRYYPIPMDIYARMKGWRLVQHLIWYVPNALPQPNHYISRLFDQKYEDIIVFAKSDALDYTFHKIRVPQKYAAVEPRKGKLNENGRCIGNVIRIPAYRPPTIRQHNYHVAAFPEELVYLILTAFSDPGHRILDPFLGSGTTLKVAEIMGRVGIGYEINPNYAALIEGRVREQWTPPRPEELDMIHSSTATPSTNGRRRRPIPQAHGTLFK